MLARSGNEEGARALVHYGADEDARTAAGLAPRDVALGTTQRVVLLFLLRCHAWREWRMFVRVT